MTDIHKTSLLCGVATSCLLYAVSCMAQQDPGVRGGPAGAGGALVGLNATESAFWSAARTRFSEASDVADGLGPRFNGDSCVSCHAQPAVGGSSPAVNPQVAVATLNGATNKVPPFITIRGPVREVRFKSDGGVHDLFTIQGRSDAPGCRAPQPDFSNTSNLSFRIPTPTFGLGLVENTSDEALENDAAALGTLRNKLHIGGHFNHKLGGLESSISSFVASALASAFGLPTPSSNSGFNTSGNTGTLTKFGWKAQNPSLNIFAGEAYLVEMGVTNELFTTKRGIDGTSGCLFNQLPEDSTHLVNITNSPSPASDFASDQTNFAAFMRLLEPPHPAPDTPSIVNGRNLFASVGCVACHTPQHTASASVFTGQSNRTYFPYSDFQLHDMGVGLADGITQGEAGEREFRSSPLFGVGQRLFFLHDGRTTDLLAAIRAHDSGGSEAHDVIRNFNQLTVQQQQDILNFLRSL